MMAITLYDSEQSEISYISLVLDGTYGDVRTEQFFVKNSSELHYLTDFIISLPNSDYSAGYMRDGYSVKVIVADTLPSQADWDLVGPGQPVSMDDIGSLGSADTSSYRSFFVRVSCPGNQPVSLVDQVSVKFSYIERLA